MYPYSLVLLRFQAIQNSLEEQQKKVDSLQNMVVVVDDTNTESG